MLREIERHHDAGRKRDNNSATTRTSLIDFPRQTRQWCAHHHGTILK
ncbi:MAG: hypothetical protein ACTSWN_16870 [Promethearchaeota archaeon]